MLRFTKMNGAGNDFVLFDNREGTLRLKPDEITRICDRHRGVGADGVLVLERAQNGANFRMRYYNADGGEAEMCGNGARCFARFANHLAGPLKELSFETPAGVIGATIENELVRLQMSDPKDMRLNLDLAVNGEMLRGHYIDSGVPHVVVPVVGLEKIEVNRIGSIIRRDQQFAPRGANVNFLEKAADRKISIRTYERGVEGETLACGTGVVASALIFAALEEKDAPITVAVRGGEDLIVDFRKSANEFRDVALTGPAEFVFEGSINL